MNEVVYGVGVIVTVLGGLLFAGIAIVFLGELFCITWASFSERFRDICKAESLIHDYRKNREKFLEWRDGEENMWKGRLEDLYGN
jgi:hypothetical protein